MTPSSRELTAGDGYLLRYQVWPAVDAPRATVVFLNGVMSHSGWIAPIAPALCGTGVHLVGADRRGSGANPVARGDAPSAKQLVADAAAIARAERVAGAPLIILGWCWGAVLTIHLAAELGAELNAIVFVTPGLNPTALVAGRAEEEARRAGPGPEDEACIASPITDDLFTRGPALHDFIARDPLRLTAFTRRFRTVMDRMALFAPRLLAKIGVPVHLVLAEDDRATDNAATRATFAVLPQLVTTTVPGEHGVQFDAPDALIAVIRDLIDRLNPHPTGAPSA
jgi:alpha-beta hydrolase superfamily lysophospholipase